MEIKNLALFEKLKYQLEKENNDFSQEELDEITEISINPINFADEYVDNDFQEIKYLSNLESLEVINLNIDKDFETLLQNFKKLKILSFERCTLSKDLHFENFEIDSFALICCKVPNYDFLYKMNYLKDLKIVNGCVDFKKLQGFYYLKNLDISSSITFGIDNISLPSLVYFTLQNSNVTNLDFVKNFNLLKILSISQKQFDENMKVVKYLWDKKVCIMNENIVEFKKS